MGWAKLHTEELPFDLLDILRNDYGKFVAFFEQLGHFNTSLVVKMAVQFSLFSGTLANLGTDRHHDLVRQAQTLQVLGCFGMTEKGHGSNVRGIETTATYDPKTQQFIVNTPNPKAMKTWIGGAQYCHFSVVFAHLIIGGENKGVHVFLVPMRDRNTQKLLPGVYVEDVEYKLGLNGIDNYSFGFNNVRIPRTNLLNRYSDVTPEGKYVCKFKTESQHFGATVGELSGGRIVIGAIGNAAAKSCLAIAIKYAFARKQFGPPGKSEISIMEYPSHYTRLMPLLARTFAIASGLAYVRDQYRHKHKNAEANAYGHCLTSAIKSAASFHTLHTADICRQACGGAGFRAPNLISGFLRDTHIFVTFEGDNQVLLQQVAKYLIAQYAQGCKQGGFKGTVFEYYKNGKVEFDGKEDLTCPRYQLYLFRNREVKMTEELIKRLRDRENRGEDQWESFKNEIVFANELGLAFADRLLHEQLLKDSQLCAFSISGTLSLLSKLNGLAQLQKSLAWFVTNDVLCKNLAKQVDSLVVSLSKEVSKISLDLVESFDIPSNILPPRADLSDYSCDTPQL
ncbi:peroxisomal acyl-CoA oxidase-like protein [Naegleria gruberi]|uniref:Acyl-coenzyme A oxidase n=1 Tax=Naegleria gruberi TaxID=5762 RepID=D2VWF6_NAEGR|nr:peroxisomal acyl-CoA oxidase-like protein [Naegleria gruberi]EFC38828.1 peroxisomal acyl-CoA oxidase-like protein [Naegleria gruberi]|eukprot:XP_002671572.1 peroxisomal acyl-CoA oxidase-like protein [Naegleria gruberi strain NEG-M]